MKKTLWVKLNYTKKTTKCAWATVPFPYSHSLFFCVAKHRVFCVILTQAFCGPGGAGRRGGHRGGSLPKGGPETLQNTTFSMTASRVRRSDSAVSVHLERSDFTGAPNTIKTDTFALCNFCETQIGEFPALQNKYFVFFCFFFAFFFRFHTTDLWR